MNVTDAHRLAESQAITLSVLDVNKPPIRLVVTAKFENPQFDPAVAVPADLPVALPA